MTLTEYKELAQGTPEWLDARRGIVTASVVGKLVTNATPDATLVKCPVCGAEVGGPCLSLAKKATPAPIKYPHDVRCAVAMENLPATYEVASNDTSKALIATLVAERIAGWTEETPMSSDMWRGVEAEPIARDLYSSHYELATEIGFMRLDEPGWSLGYSPDGLVGDEGLIEIKAPRAKTHINTVVSGQVPHLYTAQCQAGLMVSGRQWIDFMPYVGGLPLWKTRLYPDPAWFSAIESACIAFEQTAAEMTDRYRAATTNLPATERIDFDRDLGLVF